MHFYRLFDFINNEKLDSFQEVTEKCMFFGVVLIMLNLKKRKCIRYQLDYKLEIIKSKQ